MPLNLNIALVWSIPRNCCLHTVNKTLLVSGVWGGGGGIRMMYYTKTRILHFVYFTQRSLLGLPYLMKITNITVRVVLAGTVYCTLASPLF